MPEGDSIRRLADRLSRVVTGKTVRRFSCRTIPDDLVGRTITAVESRGKNLLVHFDDARVLHVHLRMLGRVRIESPRLEASRARYRASLGARPRPDPQLRLEVDGAIVIGSRIPVLRLMHPLATRHAPELEELGPDLLATDLDEGAAVAGLRKLPRREIGDALLVQRALAGIGNIYKSETLFLERVNPRTRVALLDDERLRALVRRAAALLRANLGSGPRRTRSALRGPTLWVYDRAGEPCLRCGTPIATFRQGAAPGRSTYHCPRCQS